MMTDPGKTMGNTNEQGMRPLSETEGLLPAMFEELSETPPAQAADRDLNLVLDLPVQVVELNVKAGDPLDLVVNGCLIAQGEVVIVSNQYGIRLTDIVSPSERLRRTSR